MSQCSAHDAEASTSHAAPPAPDVTVTHPEQGLRRADAPPAHFNEAQAEQALWQEFRDHGISINNMFTEALRIHGSPSIWLFEVSVLCQTRGLFLIFFVLGCFLILLPPVSRLLFVGAGESGSSKVRQPRSVEHGAQLLPGAVRCPRRPRGGPADGQWLAGVPTAGRARCALGPGRPDRGGRSCG
jgi:hypothetical protein